MNNFDRMNITIGHVARHTPAGSGAPGREAAIIDIAQDLLLSYLKEIGLLDAIVIKGGTAIRKLYAGKEGRFSLDLDFAVEDEAVDREEKVLEFVSAIEDLKLGQFSYTVSERRNKWYIEMTSPFNEGELFKTKLDFAPRPWLEPVERQFCELPIHKQYGFDLPAIKTVRLEENMAEKIARLNRTNTARDIYDLNWIMEQPSIERTIDKDLLRSLSVLKIWVDSHGMHCGNTWWRPAHAPSVFEPDRWLNGRDPKEIDREDIGTLAVPAPLPEEMVQGLKDNFSFLQELSDEETQIAHSNAKDRSLVIRTMMELPDARLTSGLY